MNRPNGAVLYHGPSMLDGAPIVAIVTGLANSSANGKTGDMLQTWILRADVAPLDAIRSGADSSVCGDCKHRPANLGTCYVQVFQAPRSIFDAFQRGIYPDATDIAALGAGRAVRLGAYGDPAAVPAEIWQQLISRATMHTGYTHQWMRDDAQAYAAMLMASADDATEREMAQSIGFRTFTVRTADEALAPRESVCPASAEAGHKLNCQTCGACNGAGTGRRGSISIVVHGAMARRFNEARA